jgi:hypothetical protein
MIRWQKNFEMLHKDRVQALPFIRRTYATRVTPKKFHNSIKTLQSDPLSFPTAEFLNIASDGKKITAV